MRPTTWLIIEPMTAATLLWSITSFSNTFVRSSSAFTHATANRLTLLQVTQATRRSASGSSSNCRRVPDYMAKLFAGPPLTEEVDPGVVDGTDLRIVKYPHPALRAENAEITQDELQGDEIKRIAQGMLKVMYAAEGVGLAAPQVGINKRLMVYNPSGDSKKWMEETILVNPQIVEFSEAQDTEVEGCLSFPGMNGEVTRSKWIKVQCQNLKGKIMKKKFTGWEARIFQHEYDHLDGTVYVDRLTEEGRSTVQPRLDELVQEFGEGGAV